MDRKKFEQLVNEGIQAIPKKFLDKLDNVSIVVEEEPNKFQREETGMRRGSILFGLYEGVPQTARGYYYGSVLPDKITIFQKPIEQFAKTDDAIRDMVCETVWHEIAHHFGMDEKEVREAEKKRNS
ncbi:metallopeptidase family protein [Patescibacteria group bacterium]|nr:metallopeptidase family protein [Patescibacteria group bacterium]MBU1674044.1 metallopeptidase family protein [Patescibacteria group bacterium]MBU1963192.1 metallopeptidase family protein [Patescibacteria group bacterium]